MKDGEVSKLPRGSRELSQVKFVHQDKVGYIFPSPTTVQLSNQEEKGRWSDITDQKNISTEVVSMDVFKLWFDHGKSPDSASYQYIVVPGVSEQELTETNGNNRGIKIIANTSEVQAVSNKKLGIAQIAFYKAAEVKVSDSLTVRMDGPGMAMLKIRDDKVYELTVSDPTRKSSRVMVTLSGKYNVEGDHQISFAETAGGSTLIILDLPTGVYAGKSMTVGLN